MGNQDVTVTYNVDEDVLETILNLKDVNNELVVALLRDLSNTLNQLSDGHYHNLEEIIDDSDLSGEYKNEELKSILQMLFDHNVIVRQQSNDRKPHLELKSDS